MRGRDMAYLAALRRALDFLDKLPESLPTGNVRTGRERLRAVVAEIAGHLEHQDLSRHLSLAAADAKRRLWLQLVEAHMRPLAAVALEEKIEDSDGALKMPKTRQTERLLAAAKAMALGAEPHAAAFIAAGLREDFLAQLTLMADLVQAQVAERAKHVGALAGATAGAEKAVTRGKGLIRYIDRIVTPGLAGDASRLAGWRVAKHVTLRAARNEAAVHPLAIFEVPVAATPGGAEPGTAAPRLSDTPIAQTMSTEGAGITQIIAPAEGSAPPPQ